MEKNNIVNSEILSNLELHTKLSKEQRKSLINWFNKQNIEFLICQQFIGHKNYNLTNHF
jgi:superfamily II DNA/RNA helicase